MTQELRNLLEREGYLLLKEVAGKGICGVRRFIYTIALVYGLDENGYEGRYCYSNSFDAIEALNTWSGKGDPPDSNWIKHKGEGGQYANLNIKL